jgi:hypothetical protein
VPHSQDARLVGLDPSCDHVAVSVACPGRSRC